jgi:short-subunit dehydrogenase
MLDAGSDDAMRRELEVNLFGTLRMCRAFSPILARNGGGAIVNVLSVVSWFTAPFNATYCASKHAALALTDSVRIELKQQGTQVVGVFAGLIDTDMVKRSAQPKTPPSQVAARTLEGLRAGADQVLADSRAEEIWRSMRSDPARLAAAMQAAWLASGR